MAQKQSRGRNQLRIIGGDWRGRKFSFPHGDGLRPTPDRVRETLFNWLTNDVYDAHCLDLFAGSGALGLEALSRGAASCYFIDSSGPATKSIKEHLQTLECARGRVLKSTAQDFLKTDVPHKFDLVFLDPPFADDALSKSCELLERSELLSADGMIYLESSSRAEAPVVPANWQEHREKQAGDVRYQLFVRSE